MPEDLMVLSAYLQIVIIETPGRVIQFGFHLKFHIRRPAPALLRRVEIRW
jgi:hypothetical protein